MDPGFYVVRMPKNGSGSRLIVESTMIPDRQAAEDWVEIIKIKYPLDDVFVIER
jgi:hypothetical protein